MRVLYVYIILIMLKYQGCYNFLNDTGRDEAVDYSNKVGKLFEKVGMRRC